MTVLRLRGPRLQRAVVALALAALTTGAAAFGCPADGGPAAAPRYQAPLPRPLVLAQGVSSANPDHLFRNQAWDFARMRQVFNAVSLMPEDQTTVAHARKAGLAVVLEFDYKADFFAGKDITAKVQAVVQQIRTHPGTIAAIHVADQLNKDYDAGQGVRYLAATGRVFHRELPGVPVLVNAPDWELTCGMRGQSSCASTDPQYRHETHATLDAFKDSGYVDGFTLSDNLKNNDAAVQRQAWREARKRWPSPFLLWSTCFELSSPDQSRPRGAAAAAELADAYMTAPMTGGAEGLALWAWHQLYEGDIYTFLDSKGNATDIWRAMVAASAAVRQRQVTGTSSR
ncbi:hypothetical protein [Streptomyces sp. TLI_185]|uniref:hypothetical protein n=1 Tax=Streptomyces sp. TLI_185 TaxID=2485151 RepID=UPI000F4EC063|nr:hypothetical protein [Streptomyces sp. TLI_185]RPF38102.1 hypothetical protein EDD92_8216 [Streptomyces sp. TLI_185]